MQEVRSSTCDMLLFVPIPVRTKGKQISREGCAAYCPLTANPSLAASKEARRRKQALLEEASIAEIERKEGSKARRTGGRMDHVAS